MAEKFLTLMADLDENSQEIMSGWYKELQDAGFEGKQTPGLPFHISLANFSLDDEAKVVNEMHRLAEEFTTIPIHISHIGMFAGGKVLFCAPDMNPPELVKLHNSIRIKTIDEFTWTPHATILIDEQEVINDALKVFVKSFSPFMSKITGLHLCAFWPTREIEFIKFRK